MTEYRKKLIEVSLPLDAINKESAREKSIRHGHPSTLHLWWARRPLAACRAVLFSSLVNDPEDDPMYGIDKEVAYTERAKLFDLIEELVKWENSNDSRVINAARLEIARSIAANKVADEELDDDTSLVANAPKLPDEQAKYLPDPPPEYTPHDVRFKMPSLRPEQVNHFLAHYAPPVLDPFAGGGSIPLEAQRLGLRAYASDLNPVPVLINKALIEIPPKFAGLPPVNPQAKKGKLKTKIWHGAEGLAEDVRYYGQWMRDEAKKRIGHLYPKVRVTEKMAIKRRDLEPYVGRGLTVIAWLWARTIQCANPGCSRRMPMLRSFWLSRKKARPVYCEPIVNRQEGTVRFEIRTTGTPVQNTSDRSMARCLFCETVLTKQQVRDQAATYGLEEIPYAIAAAGKSERVYFDSDVVDVPDIARPDVPEVEQEITNDHRWFSPPLYGLPTFHDLFTSRQLATLVTLSDLLGDVVKTAAHDCDASNRLPNGEAEKYATSVTTYLAFAISRAADRGSTICSWDSSPKMEALRNSFGRQALPMTWDFAEGNPFSDSSGNWTFNVEWVAKVLDQLKMAGCVGVSNQRDATDAYEMPGPVVSTDPPYYDNIGYADLSDFFYVWLRRSLAKCYSELFTTVLTPKSTELIASAQRHSGSKSAAKSFFEKGLQTALTQAHALASSQSPVTVYYAFKQSESDSGGEASTGWETFLSGVIASGFSISGTWPVRTELSNRIVGSGTNALASSIVLVCRHRLDDAQAVTRRDFANALRKELPDAIKHLQSGNVAPVDLAQASIGPGMAVFSRYKQVVNADGSPMSVREALQMINQVLDEALNEQESDFDSETRFAVRWFEQYGMNAGPFGDAETLAKAMAVAVSGVVEAGILASRAGKVRLLKRDELAAHWNPATDRRSTIWECTQHLIRRLEADGESAAAELLADIQQVKGSEAGEVARELAYRLYSTCERKSRATDALSYNGLVVSWPEISRMARDLKNKQPQAEQRTMFDE